MKFLHNEELLLIKFLEGNITVMRKQYICSNYSKCSRSLYITL